MSQPADADFAHAGSASGALLSRAWPDDASSAAKAKATWPKTVLRPTTLTANMFGYRSVPTKRCVDGPTSATTHGPLGQRAYHYEPTFLLRGLTQLHIEFTPTH